MKHHHPSKSIASLAAVMVAMAGGYLAMASPQALQGRKGPSIPVAQPLPTPGRAAPASPAGHSLSALAQEAELVFLGDVVDLRYVQSRESGPGRPALPYTFVSYRVQTVLRGTAPSETVTLRFIGGVDPATGLYLRASNTPQFDLGDTDILFVAGNGKSLSPLVEETGGRLRVIDGQVYTESGQSLTLTPEGRLRAGRTYDLEDVRTTVVRGQVQVTSITSDAISGPSDAAPVDAVLQAILDVAVGQPAPQTAFVSTDPFASFVGPDFTAAGPPADPQVATTQVSAEELAERASIPAPDRSIVRNKIQRTQRPAPVRQAPDQGGDR